MGEFIKNKISNNEKIDIKELIQKMKSKQESTGEYLLKAILEVVESKDDLEFSDIPSVSYVYALLRNTLTGDFSLGIEGINERRIGETAVSIVKDKNFPEDLKNKILKSGIGGLYVPSSVRPEEDYGLPSHQDYGFTPLKKYPNQELEQSDLDYLEKNGIRSSLNEETGAYEIKAPFSYLPETTDTLRQKLQELYRNKK